MNVDEDEDSDILFSSWQIAKLVSLNQVIKDDYSRAVFLQSRTSGSMILDISNISLGTSPPLLFFYQLLWSTIIFVLIRIRQLSSIRMGFKAITLRQEELFGRKAGIFVYERESQKG